jgi:hypothetical protein
MAVTRDHEQKVARMEIPNPVMVRVLTDKSPAERLAIAQGMWRSAREMLRNVPRSEHPEWTREQVDAEVARRLSLCQPSL